MKKNAKQIYFCFCTSAVTVSILMQIDKTLGADHDQGCLQAEVASPPHRGSLLSKHHTQTLTTQILLLATQTLQLTTQTTVRMCDTGMGVVASIISCLLLITIYILDQKVLEIANIESKPSQRQSAMGYFL